MSDEKKFEERYELDKMGRVKVPIKANFPTVQTSIHERTLGSLIHATAFNAPPNQGAHDLVTDAFFAMYRDHVHTTDEPRPDRKVNKALIDWTIQMQDFQAGKQDTVGNMAASLASAGMLWESLLQEDSIREALEKQAEAEELERQANQMLQEMAQHGDRGDQEKADDAFKRAEELRKQAEQAGADAEKGISDMQNNPLAQGMVQGAVQRAGAEGEKVAGVMRGWGIEPGELSFEDANDVLHLAQNSTQSMEELAEFIGRFKKLATESIEAVKVGYTGQVTEAMMTDDISRLFPIQQAYLSVMAPPYLRAKSIARLYSGGLLGWRPKFEGKRSGAFVGMVDRSGSMNGLSLTIAKAVSIGIAKALVDDNSLTNREYSLTYFQTQVERELTVTSKDDWRQHIAWAQVGVSGGTNFDDALMYAMDKIEQMGADGINGADILFITDDGCMTSPEVLTRLKRLKELTGVRLLVVRIGAYMRYGSLEEDADMMIDVSPHEFAQNAEAVVYGLTTNIVKAEIAR
jgi:uncharacterized protein with von Willebrand factor type A (vWA) domain